MKKFIIFLSLLFITTSLSNAQQCSLYEQGKVIKSSMKTWFPMKPMMPEWAKMKQAEKNKTVDEFNKNAESGTEKPSYEGSFEMPIDNIVAEPNADLITFTSVFNGVEYKTYTACLNDTMYFVRGPRFSIEYKDRKPAGYKIIGVQIIPNKLKVGDMLTPYTDFGETFPETKEWQERVTIFAGYEEKKETGNGLFLDAYDSKWKSGTYERTYSEAVYVQVMGDFKQKSSFSMETRNYVNARVVKEEVITIDGQPYNAYVIESQKWVKAGPDVSIKSNIESWQKNYDKISAKIAKKANKEIAAMGILNEQGYMVTYTTDWFVPGLGIVKSIGYDSNGFLTLITSWDSFK